MRILIPALALCLGTAFGQSFSAGVKVGAPASAAFETATTGNTSYFSDTKRYTFGPTVEVGLPLRLAVEVDALYKRLNYDSNSSDLTGLTHRSTTGNSWEIPVMLKYRLASGPIRPFISGGVSSRHVDGETRIDVFGLPSSTVPARSTASPTELNNSWTAGVVFGGGIDIGLKKLHLTPEIRYTRWGTESFRTAASDLLRSNLNQMDFLLGITF